MASSGAQKSRITQGRVYSSRAWIYRHKWFTTYATPQYVGYLSIRGSILSFTTTDAVTLFKVDVGEPDAPKNVEVPVMNLMTVHDNERKWYVSVFPPPHAVAHGDIGGAGLEIKNGAGGFSETFEWRKLLFGKWWGRAKANKD